MIKVQFLSKKFFCVKNCQIPNLNFRAKTESKEVQNSYFDLKNWQKTEFCPSVNMRLFG